MPGGKFGEMNGVFLALAEGVPIAKGAGIDGVEDVPKVFGRRGKGAPAGEKIRRRTQRTKTAGRVFGKAGAELFGGEKFQLLGGSFAVVAMTNFVEFCAADDDNLVKSPSGAKGFNKGGNCGIEKVHRGSFSKLFSVLFLVGSRNDKKQPNSRQ